MIPIKGIVSTVGKFCSKNSSTLLSIGACLGVVATGYFGVKAGMKMQEDLVNLQFDKIGEDITPKEKATVIVKNCATTVAVGGLTMAMIASSRIIDIRRAKAMAASYAVLSEAAETFRQKAVEKIGEHKVDEINSEIAKEHIEKDWDKIEKKEIIPIQTSGGTYLCRDCVTGQYFRADAKWIKDKEKVLNKERKYGEKITVNDYCRIMELEPVIESFGKMVWPISMEFDFNLSSCICPNGEPGYSIELDLDKYPRSKDLAEAYDENHYCDCFDEFA